VQACGFRCFPYEEGWAETSPIFFNLLLRFRRLGGKEKRGNHRRTEIDGREKAATEGGLLFTAARGWPGSRISAGGEKEKRGQAFQPSLPLTFLYKEGRKNRGFSSLNRPPAKGQQDFANPRNAAAARFFTRSRGEKKKDKGR